MRTTQASLLTRNRKQQQEDSLSSSYDLGQVRAGCKTEQEHLVLDHSWPASAPKPREGLTCQEASEYWPSPN